MTCTRLRDKMRKDEPAFGCWTSLADGAVIEMIANAGFDYVSIDMEHSPLDTETVIGLLRTATAAGISALVRIAGSDPALIGRICDMGPDGIYIPHVADAADARRAVNAAKYAPVGDRGISQYSRAANYGAGVADPTALRKHVNDHLIVWAQIEEQSAVDDIDAIAGLEGIDVCGIAPHDLARSLGCSASTSEPRLMACVSRVAEAVKRSGNAKLAVPATVFGIETALALGSAIINVADATQILAGALRQRHTAARALL